MRTVFKSTLPIMAVFMFLMLVGCATIGTEFNTDAVSRIVIGETGQADMQTLFGDPWRTGIEDGSPTWTYACYRLRLFKAPETSDLYVRFDATGKVASYAFNSTKPVPTPAK